MVNTCGNPAHAEPYGCHRVAEGGFVCESTLQLEKFLYAIPGNGEAATFHWNMGVIEMLVDDGESQGPRWVPFLDPEHS